MLVRGLNTCSDILSLMKRRALCVVSVRFTSRMRTELSRSRKGGGHRCHTAEEALTVACQLVSSGDAADADGYFLATQCSHDQQHPYSYRSQSLKPSLRTS